MNKKVIFGLSLVLVALFAIIAGSTFAWLTDKGESDTITYTVGEVDYEISVDSTTTEKVVPGDFIAPTFNIENKSNVETNLRIKLTIEGASGMTIGEEDTNHLILTLNTDWVKDGDYYYFKNKDKDAGSIALDEDISSHISSLVINGEKVDNEFATKTINIKVLWEVKQAAHVDWNAVGLTFVEYPASN